MEKLDQGYVYRNTEERKQSFAWLRKNRRKLPKMSNGKRINGDPIFYVGTQPPDYLSLMQTLPDQFDGQAPADLSPEDVENSPITQLLKTAMANAELTPIEAWVLAFRSMGVSQQQIGDCLQIAQQTVSCLELRAKRKLKKALPAISCIGAAT